MHNLRLLQLNFHHAWILNLTWSGLCAILILQTCSLREQVTIQEPDRFVISISRQFVCSSGRAQQCTNSSVVHVNVKSPYMEKITHIVSHSHGFTNNFESG